MLLMVSDTHRIDQTHKVCITLEVIDKRTQHRRLRRRRRPYTSGPEMPISLHLCL